MTITGIETTLFTVPPARSRVSLSDPKPPANASVVAVNLHTDGNHIGVGFTTSPVAGSILRNLIDTELASLIVGEDANDTERLFARARNRFRSAGWPGLASRAYAVIDIALWDLKAKAAGLPLFKLLGGARSAASCFIGDLASAGTDPQQTIRVARPFLEQGVLGVSIEVGGGDVQLDADRVQQIRDGLGESAWLGIAADGRYDLGTALAMAHFYEEDVGVDWLDFPIPVEDRMGYKRLAERMEVPLALGSTFDDRDDFLRVLERGDIRVLRPDPLRLGGITPFLKLAALAEAFQVAVVPFRMPEIGVNLACGLPNVPMAEWSSWLATLFVEPIAPRNGKLVPPQRAGHGLELNSRV
jgi:L-talarate/galactarate dehydratase